MEDRELNAQTSRKGGEDKKFIKQEKKQGVEPKTNSKVSRTHKERRRR
jgi:hypothetical protein